MDNANSKLRLQIYAAAFKLCFGSAEDREHALSTLALLVSALQQEQHLTKKD